MNNFNKTNFWIILLLFLCNQFAKGQISQGGTPPSFIFGDKINATVSVPVEKMPYVDVERLMSEDLIYDQYKDIPWRFGENIEVDIDRETHGVEQQLPDGRLLWRVSVWSPGALSINLLFDKYKLPPGAELYIYNQDRSMVLGAFTDFNNQEDLLFATTLIRGDFITIEYVEPIEVPFRGLLHLSRVTHGYRGPEAFLKGFGQSGSCNVNVACPQSAGMEDQIRSVCMLVSGGNGFCSGALINNTANDGKPYVLSANHCYSNPGSVVFWFNWQSPTCSNPPTSPPYNSMSGATDKAKNAASDFWLMELNQSIPSNFNVYFAGWNRTTDNNISGKVWGIHHPSGDIKKISWSNTGVSTTSYLSNPVPGDGSHWRITTWSDGTTTEGGSSGSPLFDPQGRIIGQLHGGYASCTSITSDWYGKLGVSWTGGGTNTTRLSNWLDPQNTGVTTLDGYDPNFTSVALDVQLLDITVPEPTYCSLSSIIPTVVIKNRGTQTLTSATVQYVLNGGAPQIKNWTGSLTTGQTATITFNPINLTAGVNQTFVATVSNPNGGVDENPSNNQMSLTFSASADFVAPFSENFDGAVFPPPCWTQEYVSGNTSWIKSNGGQSGNPPAAYSGNGNALLYYGSYTSTTTKLVTPPLKIGNLTNATLTFRHAQVAWSGDQDELRVYYKTSPTGSWNLLQTYTTEVPVWTERTIALPNVSQNYYIAFEGKTKYGYGVCIDNVLVTGTNVGIDETNNLDPVVYPNPSNNGLFNVDFTMMTEKPALFQVYDVNGKNILTKTMVDAPIQTLDLSHLDRGMYFIRFVGEQMIFVKKVVIH